ncbi:MAG: M50 family metallopeptidase [Chlorobia bacterium]|nr:M50 family metallopeptidase [Fimbriimonadaceae bacterium]
MLERLNSFLNWSVRVGRMFGIPISLHITLVFFLVPAISGRGLGLWYSLEWIVLVVLSILLHELGHALTAKRFRLTNLSIMLHGFGGFAVSSGNRTPTQSLMISLAGPAVTFVLGFLCLGIGAYGGDSATPGTQASTQLFLIESLGRFNILLGILNLLPSLPFDGGQALVAILNRRISEFKATRRVGHLGLILTPILAIYGFLTNNGFLTIFGLMGFLTSLMTLLQTGGVRFRESLDDRRDRKEVEAVNKRREEKTQAYLSEVQSREKQREEKERLRKILEASMDD